MDVFFSKSEGQTIGSKVCYAPEAESTNTEATKGLAEKALEGSTYIVDYQTKGRGQRGNFWESEQGKNLTFSILVYPNFLPILDHFYLSKVVANGMVEVLDSVGIKAKVKWPNDIYVGDKKIAGILIENGLMGANLSHSIWGVGLNVNQTEFKSNAPNPTSVMLLLGTFHDRNNLLHAVLYAIDGWYAKLKAGCLNEIDSYYWTSLYRNDGWYWYESEGERFKARIRTIEHTGELTLENEKGELKSFAFKEVSFII